MPPAQILFELKDKIVTLYDILGIVLFKKTYLCKILTEQHEYIDIFLFQVSQLLF
jgi:hypothetical protein